MAEGRRAMATQEMADHPEVEIQEGEDRPEAATPVIPEEDDHRVAVTQVIPEVEDHQAEAIHRVVVIRVAEDRPEAGILLEVAIQEGQTLAIRRFNRSSRAHQRRVPLRNRAAHPFNR
jgi:hypothetical protein